MPKYVFTYLSPSATLDPDPESSSSWMSWFDRIKESVVELGQPVSTTGRVGSTAAQNLSGYSVIRADDLDAALAIARTCPAIEHGFGVEVGELLEMDRVTA